MTEALARARPGIDDPKALDRVVRRLVEQFDPVAVYLFGSHARGDGDEDSDYDLMVVVRDDTPDEVLKSKWRFSPRASSVDVKFRRRARFAGRMRRVGTLEHEVVCEGLQLYPPGANPLDFEGARRPQPIASPDVEIVGDGWAERAGICLGPRNLARSSPKPRHSISSRQQKT
jgi:predicted nucleotidyltransferase